MGKKRNVISALTELSENLKKEKENHVFSESDYKSYKAGWRDGVQFVLDYVSENYFESREDAWKPVIHTARGLRSEESKNT
jgi:hypothetical protein|tara:strand:+ start:537 stop:779 length:243 start_codon:yes stop_codon:yes gene_type:complete